MFNDFKQKQFEFDCMSTMTDLIEEDFTYTRQDVIEHAKIYLWKRLKLENIKVCAFCCV